MTTTTAQVEKLDLTAAQDPLRMFPDTKAEEAVCPSMLLSSLTLTWLVAS